MFKEPTRRLTYKYKLITVKVQSFLDILFCYKSSGYNVISYAPGKKWDCEAQNARISGIYLKLYIQG